MRESVQYSEEGIKMKIVALVGIAAVMGAVVPVEAVSADKSAAAVVDPTKLEFRLLSSRRFMLDNELILSEFVPSAVVRPSLQNPVIPVEGKAAPKVRYANGAASFEVGDAAGAEGSVFIGAYFPGVHFSADVRSLSSGSAALLELVSYDRSICIRMRAEPGKTVEFSELVDGKPVEFGLKCAQTVPAPPFRLSMVTAGPTILLAVRKDDVVSILGSVTLDNEPDIRRKDLAGTLKCAAGAALPAGGTAVLERAAVTLTAGVGQADFRIVTEGPTCRPYMEGDRIFCTFSARAGMKYTKSVASFNPTLFDFKMEGILLTNYGDGDNLLRNDGVNHLFRDSDGTWKGIAVGWSTTAHNLSAKSRTGSGLVVCESKENPLHGIHVLKARPLVIGDGLKSEDPYFTFDPETNRWRLATSTITPKKGLRAHLWESDRWDGPYTRIAGPVPYDSTGCQIMDFGGAKYVMTANAKWLRPVYSYPSLDYVGEWQADFIPYNRECGYGRIFPAFAEMPESFPYRYIMLTMDRQNFPGMPKPNWTYGGMYLYGANPPPVVKKTPMPCKRISFGPMPRLMRYGDTTLGGNERPFAKDPTVIRHNGRYLMYYSTRYGAKDFPGKLAAGRKEGWWGAVAESTDLVNWKCLGSIRLKGGPDFASACVAPCVKKLDGRIHMFHQAKIAGSREREMIWHATSKDGITFTCNGTKPVFKPDNKWSFKRAIDAEVYKVRDKLVLLYATRDSQGKRQMLGMACAPYGSSYDSRSWTEFSVNAPLLQPEQPWEMNCIEAGTVIRRNGIWYMFYAGAYNHERQQIGVAWSADGMNFTRMLDGPVFPHGKEGEWNAFESGHPGIFEDDDGQVYLFYQGKATLDGNYQLSCVKVKFAE